jgi:hypothetical protein
MRKSASGDENSPCFRYNGNLSADLRRKAYLYRHRYPRRPKDRQTGEGFMRDYAERELEKHRDAKGRWQGGSH